MFSLHFPLNIKNVPISLLKFLPSTLWINLKVRCRKKITFTSTGFVTCTLPTAIFISLETKTIQVCYAKLINFPIYVIHSKELNNYHALIELFKCVSHVIRYFIGLPRIHFYTASIKTRTNQTRSVAHISSRPEPTVVSSSHNSVIIIGFRIILNLRPVFDGETFLFIKMTP